MRKKFFFHTIGNIVDNFRQIISQTHLCKNMVCSSNMNIIMSTCKVSIDGPVYGKFPMSQIIW